MKHRIAPTYFATGAQHERDMTSILCGLRDADMAAGGPLDAPAYVPAGAHTSTDVCDWQGRPVPAAILVFRVAA